MKFGPRRVREEEGRTGTSGNMLDMKYRELFFAKSGKESPRIFPGLFTSGQFHLSSGQIIILDIY